MTSLSYEEALVALEAVEAKLAARLNLEGDVHAQLVRLAGIEGSSEESIQGEDELVEEWYELFCTVLRHRNSLEEQKIESLRAELAATEAKADAMEAKAAAIEANNKRVEAEIAEMRDETTRWQAETAAIKAEAAQIEAETAKIQAENERVEAEIAEMVAETARLRRGALIFQITLVVFCVFVVVAAYILASKL